MPDLPDEAKLLSKEELAAVVEHGIEKWMDKKFTQFGKWTLAAIGVAGLGFLIKLVVSHGGQLK